MFRIISPLLIFAFFINPALAQIKATNDLSEPGLIQTAWIFDYYVSHEKFFKIETGEIEVDMNDLKIRLSLSEPVHCGPDEDCPNLTKTHVVELPLSSVTTESCGAVVYTASVKAWAGGESQSLVVVDNTALTCEKPLLPYMTDITYKTVSSENGQETLSHFGAKPLQNF